MTASTLGTRGFSRVRREFSVEFSVLAEATSGEAARKTGHCKDLTETGNHARKASVTQGRLPQALIRSPYYTSLNSIGLENALLRYRTKKDPSTVGFKLFCLDIFYQLVGFY